MTLSETYLVISGLRIQSHYLLTRYRCNYLLRVRKQQICAGLYNAGIICADMNLNRYSSIFCLYLFIYSGFLIRNSVNKKLGYRGQVV